MQDIAAQGRAWAIGVSNFAPDQLLDLIINNDVVPVDSQIETHPFKQNTDYHQLMRTEGVQIESWGPFAEGKRSGLRSASGRAMFPPKEEPMKIGFSSSSRDEIAAAIAADIHGGSFVNLGIGQPTLVADHLAADSGVVLHTENGMLNMGPAATGDEIDADLINAGKMPVTELPGASYFHHADSFAMMRGGHLDVCVLGAFQVSTRGDLANWHTGVPGAIPAVGGAMDLAIGAKQVFVMMTLTTKDGTSKLVEQCTYPLTGVGCVTRVYTDLATFDVGDDGVTVRDLHGTTLAELRDVVGIELELAS